jgi:signal transduction histidine kinase
MRLAVFLRQHTREILTAWDAFAQTLETSNEGWSKATLRDDALQLLEVIILAVEANTVATHDADLQQAAVAPNQDTAAALHGTLRRRIGFSLTQVTAEFRALRATVLRLWLPQLGIVREADSNDLIRFNDAIDQALGESVVMYAEHASRTKDTFLAVLGHDLRSPLATVTMAGEFLTRATTGDDEIRAIGSRVRRSGATMAIMIGDLLEFARSQLGGEIPVHLELDDIAEVAGWALDDARAAHPECKFELQISGSTVRHIDSARIQQVLSNLLNNAAQFNLRDSPVSLMIYGSVDGLIMMVHNFGMPINPEAMRTIFDPLVRFQPDAEYGDQPTTSLGLGLFIARQIVVAHGGTIVVKSDPDTGTVFKVWIPTLDSSPESESSAIAEPA